MKPLLATLGRAGVTIIAVVLAVLVGWRLWGYYMEEPWTRDGRVRADVVGVTPDVSGLVAEVLVRDDQAVKRGDVLFRVDRARFDLALRTAEAVVASRRAQLNQAGREVARYRQLTNLSVSQEKQEQLQSQVEVAAAAYQQALVDRDLAKLNLDRAEITAPVNGRIANFDLRPGDYVSAGKPVTALVDTDTIHVDGYFEETKLPLIRIGDPAEVRLLGERRTLSGVVDSIAGGIEDRERTAGANLLANVNPTFSWVRLAQRIPVRIALRDVPGDMRLVAGRTATVTVLPRR